jgi:hypothetical protein
VAVWVATGDRRERVRERERDDRAQASLVIVDTGRTWVEERRRRELVVVIQNHGTFAVLDVSLAQLDVDGHHDVHPVAHATFAFVQPYREAPEKGRSLFCPPPEDRDDPFSIALNGRLDDFSDDPYREGLSDITANAKSRSPTIGDDTQLTATVRFTDAKGKRWETVFRADAQQRDENDRNVRYPRHLALRQVAR